MRTLMAWELYTNKQETVDNLQYATVTGNKCISIDNAIYLKHYYIIVTLWHWHKLCNSAFDE